jgi:inorganic pyrophosphatase
MDAPAFPGCILDCVLLGAIEAEQSNGDGAFERNDRLIAADVNDATFSNVSDIEQLPAALLEDRRTCFCSRYGVSRTAVMVNLP